MRSRKVWPRVKFKILNFGNHWANRAMAGALEWGFPSVLSVNPLIAGLWRGLGGNWESIRGATGASVQHHHVVQEYFSVLTTGSARQNMDASPAEVAGTGFFNMWVL